MKQAIARYFRFESLKTNYKTEIIAGLTTFFTVAYVLVVHPKILEAAGIPFGPSLVATILSAFFGTMAMGLYARRPIAILPYMGENAFVAYTVVQVLGFSWQTALGAICISGIVFTIITVVGIRGWLARSIPASLKIAFAVGIGLFLTYIGLTATGIVVLGDQNAPVHIGNLTELPKILTIICFLLIGTLTIRNVAGAILWGMLITTILAFILNVADVPSQWISRPPSLGPIFLKLNVAGALGWGFLSVVLTVLILDFVDTVGTLLGLGVKAGFLDANGELPEIEKPMLCDALATVVAALLGTTTAGAYLESASGIQAGGRSGFTSVITALLFLLALFFAPTLTAVPACAYGAALIFVGVLMMEPVRYLDVTDLTETIPAFGVIILMCFSFNLGIGLAAGFVLYPLVKILAGRYREINAGMWALGLVCLLFYVFYPY